MNILFLDTIYPSVLDEGGYLDRPKPGDVYRNLVETLDGEKFSAGSMYMPGLIGQNHKAQVIYVNARKAQELWVNKFRLASKNAFSWIYWQAISRIPVFGPWIHNRSEKVKVVLSQISQIRPDVVFCLNINFLNNRLVKRIKSMGAVVVGQIASPLPPASFYRSYDHIFSAHPGQVEHFKSQGVSSSWLPLAFDLDQRDFFDKTGWPERTRDVTFVGTFGRHQRNTGPLLSAIAKEIPSLQIFTLSKEKKLKRFGLTKFLRGKAWGAEMYKIFAESKIVINRHGAVADGFSVNFRMFEATGMGALLVTEKGKNTSDLFEPGREILTYNSIDDAVQVIKNALADFDRYQSIALAGQHRTLTEHTYEKRSKEIDGVLRELLEKLNEAKAKSGNREPEAHT
jgi:spore maturation protein CgeB